MYKHTIIQRLKHKYEQLFGKYLAPVRRLMINNRDFSIISNNCWGGIVYEFFGLKKTSPTCGMYIFAEDYLKFLENLRYYLSLDMRIIPAEESKHYEAIRTTGDTTAPVGVLDDVEVVMLHYRDPKVALEKWEKRKGRVNFDNLIAKFSYMNECTPEMLYRFDQIDFASQGIKAKKICFVPNQSYKFSSAVYLKGFEQEPQITNDTFTFKEAFFLVPFVNGWGLYRKP